jgi:large subunit ribosomal protein L21
MYAIIKTGGKQYRVAVGDVIDVELLNDTTEKGAKVQFGEVLFTNDGSKSQLGSPSIAQFLVHGEVQGMVAGEKVTGLKYKASHTYCRKWGHRQKYTRVKITAIGQHNEKGGKHGN